MVHTAGQAPRLRSRGWRRCVTSLMLLTGAVPAVAQERFTQQVVLVPFPRGLERKLADAVGDALRGQLRRLLPRAEATVVHERAMEVLLERASIERQTSDTFYVRVMAKYLRADEIVSTQVSREGARIRVSGSLILTRDNKRLVQPLATVTAQTTDSAGVLMAREVVLNRRQLAPHRRCENALREFESAAAITAARAGLQQGADGALLRACLVSAMLQDGAAAPEVLAEAERLMRLDSASYFGMDAAARAFDAMKQKDKAAAMWLRLLTSRATDSALARRVVQALLTGGNATHARPIIDQLVIEAPDDLGLLRLRWQVLYAVRAWSDAGVVGDRLAAEDVVSRDDSNFTLQHALAHRGRGDTVRAVALAAAGVGRFPRDARLYVLYTDLVQADAPRAAARGLSRFPEVADLHILRAQELRRGGKNAEAIVPLQKAVALVPESGQTLLTLAQTHADLGQPDSALSTARLAVKAGGDSGVVGQFVLSRGNALYRAATGTKQRRDYQQAMDYLAFADSLQGSVQSHFLLGATALAVAQSAATEAPEAKDCDLSRLSNSLLPLAREKITAGAVVAPDAARQYLDYLSQLEPAVAQQLQALCGGAPSE